MSELELNAEQHQRKQERLAKLAVVCNKMRGLLKNSKVNIDTLLQTSQELSWTAAPVRSLTNPSEQIPITNAQTEL